MLVNNPEQSSPVLVVIFSTSIIPSSTSICKKKYSPTDKSDTVGSSDSDKLKRFDTPEQLHTLRLTLMLRLFDAFRQLRTLRLTRLTGSDYSIYLDNYPSDWSDVSSKS